MRAGFILSLSLSAIVRAPCQRQQQNQQQQQNRHPNQDLSHHGQPVDPDKEHENSVNDVAEWYGLPPFPPHDTQHKPPKNQVAKAGSSLASPRHTVLQGVG